MFRHLTNTRGIIIEDKGNGIYYLKGDPIPMQLLLTPKLSEKENYWLISRHCRSMTVARRMPARASTAVALRAYRTKALKAAILRCFQGFSIAGDERIELPPKVLETPIIPFDQSPIPWPVFRKPLV